jgi:hypothetical protein
MDTIKVTYSSACDGCGKPHSDRDEVLCDACKAKFARAKVPACVESMGCLCAGHARGNAGQDACDTSEAV